ncbi:MAG: histidine phosphatase family protein [Alphaproteobacteria bacterium]|jgi:broad specificity phosphatase PhoE|nr:histidine phosphatase family protein [Alphaproteobacteria bacterium]
MKYFYIFRHGQSLWNIKQRAQGQLDKQNPLSSKGENDAKSLIPILKDKGIEVIFSSDIERARQTAEILNQKLNVTLKFDKRLREISLGDVEGLLQDEIKEKFPSFIEKLRERHDEKLAPNAESINEVKERLLNFFFDIARNRDEKIFGISAHGGVIGNFLSNLECGFMKLNNGEVVLVFYENEKFKFIKKLNSKEAGNLL